jgi:hypothetical protein
VQPSAVIVTLTNRVVSSRRCSGVYRAGGETGLVALELEVPLHGQRVDDPGNGLARDPPRVVVLAGTASDPQGTPVRLQSRRACRKVCQQAEKRADWHGFPAGFPSEGPIRSNHFRGHSQSLRQAPQNSTGLIPTQANASQAPAQIGQSRAEGGLPLTENRSRKILVSTDPA